MSEYPQQPGPTPSGQQPPTGQPGYGPPAPMTPTQERSWATIAHVAPAVAIVISAGTLGFVASLVIYLVYRERGPFVRAHAANAVNVQLTALIGLVVSGVLMLLLIGFITYPLVVVAAVVIHVVAAMKANNGEWYDPPFTIRFVR